MPVQNKVDWSNVIAGLALATVPAILTILGGTRVLDYAVSKINADLANEAETRKAQGIRLEQQMQAGRRETREEMLQLHNQQSREIDDLKQRIEAGR